MHSRFSILLIFCTLSLFAQGQTSFDDRPTTASNVRLNISNLGTLGNAFRGYRDGSGDQSCEFPAGSGIEHLFEGGIWVGAYIDGNQIAVSTSAYDAPQGYATGRAGFEFTAPVGSTLGERSSLFDKPTYNPDAVSHQDFYATFTDKNLQVPGTSIPISSHDRPLNVEVDLESYNWNYSFSDFFVILNYTVRNTGTETLDSVFFGLWTNTVVRNINITPAGSGGSAFYNKGGNGFVDSLYMAYCYDHSGDEGFTQSYVSQLFLGAEDQQGFRHPNTDPRFKVNYNAWEFNNTSNAVFFLPATEQARYAKLSKGLNAEECWNTNRDQNPNCPELSLKQQLNNAGNRSDLVSVGPFKSLAPGESFNVTYAIVLGKKKEDGEPNAADTEEQKENLYANAGWARTAYAGEDNNFNGVLDAGEDNNGDGKLTRFILPAPPDIPKTKVIAEDGKLTIYWSNNSEKSIDPITREMDFEGYRLYLTKQGFDVTQTPNLNNDLIRIADFDKEGNGLFNETGLSKVALGEGVQFENDTTTYFYKYEVENLLNGWQYVVSVSAYDRGNPASNLESLESSLLSNNYRVFCGTPPNKDLKNNAPFAYPNPYYAGAAWEGKSNFQEQSRKLYFANLPKKCIIRVFTVAGDFIDEIRHDQDYNGSDIRWYQTFGAEDAERNIFSGGQHAWDLLSENTQIIARGLYMFTVEDLDTGTLTKGSFAVIK